MRVGFVLPISLALLATGFAATRLRGGDSTKAAALEYGPKLSKSLGALFNDPDLTKASQFGTSRDPLVNAHGTVLSSDRGRFQQAKWTPSQAELMGLRDAIGKEGYQVEEGVFAPRRFPAPGIRKFDGKNPKDWQTVYEVAWLPPRSAASTLFPAKYSQSISEAADATAFGKTVYAQAKTRPHILRRGDYWVYAAPVRFEHPECLSCHRNSKMNDTACVVALAFRKK